MSGPRLGGNFIASFSLTPKKEKSQSKSAGQHSINISLNEASGAGVFDVPEVGQDGIYDNVEPGEGQALGPVSVKSPPAPLILTPELSGCLDGDLPEQSYETALYDEAASSPVTLGPFKRWEPSPELVAAAGPTAEQKAEAARRSIHGVSDLQVDPRGGAEDTRATTSSVDAGNTIRAVAEEDVHEVAPRPPPRPSLDGIAMLVTRKSNLSHMPWYLGRLDRRPAEQLLANEEKGTFLVRRGKASHVLTLKFPVNPSKTFYHVQIVYDSAEQTYHVTEGEYFSSVAELVSFYCKNSHKFFVGMSYKDRAKQSLLPYTPPVKGMDGVTEEGDMEA